MMGVSNLKSLVRLLGYADYRLYTTGNSISLIGTWMQRVTVGWLAWQLTGSGTWLGLIAFADLFPTIIVGPFAGVAADRWNLLVLLRITQALGFVLAALMAILHALGFLEIWLLFFITLALGIVTAFAQPARLSIISAMVPRSDLGSAIAMNAVVFNLARFLGPATAGILIVTVGVGWAFAANAVSYLVFVAALVRMRPQLRDRPTSQASGMFSDMIEGFAYIRQKAGVLPIMMITVAMGMGARPTLELMPGFASGVFQSDATGLALLTSSVGIGAIFGGVWMVERGAHPGLTRIFICCALGSAGSILLFTTLGSLYFAAPVMVMLGFFMVCTGISSQTLLQLSVDGKLKGRLLSTYGLLQRGCPAIGALLVGAASEQIGLRLAAASGAAILAISGLVVLGRSAAIARELDPRPDPLGKEVKQEAAETLQ